MGSFACACPGRTLASCVWVGVQQLYFMKPLSCLQSVSLCAGSPFRQYDTRTVTKSFPPSHADARKPIECIEGRIPETIACT